MAVTYNGEILRKLSYEDLKSYTNNFSKENYIGEVMFGKLYRGEISVDVVVKKPVAVKIWEEPTKYCFSTHDNHHRLMDEIHFLVHDPIEHESFVKLYGYCWEGENLGVVYDFKPLDMVSKVVFNDGFDWRCRIKVAIQLAQFLRLVHKRSWGMKPCILRNIDAAHIVIDEDYIPKFCDFGMVSGGIFPNKAQQKGQFINGSYGYTDTTAHIFHCSWSQGTDVFAFGVVLLGLISNRFFTEEDRQACNPHVCDWADEQYYGKPEYTDYFCDEEVTDCKSDDYDESGETKRCLVHESLQTDPFFYTTDGFGITTLAVRCASFYPSLRPTMKNVVKRLFKLKVVKDHPEYFGVRP
ncbi:hypothetical protein ACH5RR_037271 [Cinchona calisaya]|uniref:Protein kinase domain-containing protein n=1 Tax=Cinchona calisaya TaxID=153742 RepID=A0ABD2Y8S8_9GENT